MRFFAYLLGWSELLGGLFLALGFLTPLASAAVIGVMFNAVVGVHWNSGVWAQNGGYELPLLFGVAALTVAFTGPADSRSTAGSVGPTAAPQPAWLVSASGWRARSSSWPSRRRDREG